MLDIITDCGEKINRKFDRSEKFRIDEIRLSDIIAALICCTLSWLVVLFMIVAFFAMIGWLMWEKTKEIVIFKKDFEELESKERTK